MQRRFERMQSAKHAAEQELEKLKKSMYSQEIGKSRQQFYQTVRRYFAEYLGIKYEFTYNELVREMRKNRLLQSFMRKKLGNIVQVMQEREFGGQELTKQELSKLVSEFKVIVGSCEASTVKEGPLSLKRWFSIKLRRFTDKEAGYIPLFAESAEQALKGNNLTKAQNAYLEMDAIYRRLGADERKAAYSMLRDTYSKIEDKYCNATMEKIEQRQQEFYRELEQGRLEEAASQYSETNRLYEALPEHKRKKIYRELNEMHGKLQAADEKQRATETQRLLTHAMESLRCNDIGKAEWSYSKAEKTYENLPKKLKKKIFPELNRVYKAIGTTVS